MSVATPNRVFCNGVFILDANNRIAIILNNDNNNLKKIMKRLLHNNTAK